MLEAAPSVITDPVGFNFFFLIILVLIFRSGFAYLHLRDGKTIIYYGSHGITDPFGWDHPVQTPVTGSLTRLINESLAAARAAAARGRGPPVTAGP